MTKRRTPHAAALLRQWVGRTCISKWCCVPYQSFFRRLCVGLGCVGLRAKQPACLLRARPARERHNVPTPDSTPAQINNPNRSSNGFNAAQAMKVGGTGSTPALACPQHATSLLAVHVYVWVCLRPCVRVCTHMHMHVQQDHPRHQGARTGCSESKAAAPAACMLHTSTMQRIGAPTPRLLQTCLLGCILVRACRSRPPEAPMALRQEQRGYSSPIAERKISHAMARCNKQSGHIRLIPSSHGEPPSFAVGQVMVGTAPRRHARGTH